MADAPKANATEGEDMLKVIKKSDNPTADDAVERACQMLIRGLEARQPRMESIRKNEDMYNGVTSPALKGRSNINFDNVVMGGYIDTLLSNVDEAFSMKFNPKREQAKMAADKITAAFEVLSAPDMGAWNDKIQDSKFLAALSGRGFLKSFAGNVPKFYSDIETCDHYDMVTEPQGGAYLDKHLFKFQMNIFRTREEMTSAADQGFYNKTQVRNLILQYQDEGWFKKNSDQFNNKLARYAAFGIDITAHSYVGQSLYRLTEGVVNIDGKWWYLVFSFEARTWVRFQPLEEVFEHAKVYPGRGPWASYATHRHPFLFWTKAPADDIRPIAYTMKKLVNLTIDNLEKRNWQNRAYDPKVFTDPTQLLWKQDGLARATLANGKKINEGIYEFQTPDTTGITINLASWLDGFLGQKSGITADAQGQSGAEQATILISNIQATTRRMTLKNKMYRQMLVDLGVIFDYSLFQYLREPMAVKLIGNDGVRWEEDITREDLDEEFVVSVTSELEENEKNASTIAKKIETFKSIEVNPALIGLLNQQEYMREKLKFAGYTDEKIRVLMDRQNDGDERVMAEAAKCIDGVITSKPLIYLYRGATTGFVQKIIDFANDNYELIPPEEVAKMKPTARSKYQKKLDQFNRLMAIAQAHVPIMQKNMQRKLVSEMSQAGTASGAPTEDGQPIQINRGAGGPPINPRPVPGAAGGPQNRVARAMQ